MESTLIRDSMTALSSLQIGWGRGVVTGGHQGCQTARGGRAISYLTRPRQVDKPTTGIVGKAWYDKGECLICMLARHFFVALPGQNLERFFLGEVKWTVFLWAITLQTTTYKAKAVSLDLPPTMIRSKTLDCSGWVFAEQCCHMNLLDTRSGKKT